MKIQKNIDNIVISLQELNIIAENLNLYTLNQVQPSKIPQIDIDLALSKIRSVYNELLLVNKLNSEQEVVLIGEPQNIVVPEKQIEVKEEIIIAREIPVVKEEIKLEVETEDDMILPEIIAPIKSEPVKGLIEEVKVLIQEKTIIAEPVVIPEIKKEPVIAEVKAELKHEPKEKTVTPVKEKKESIIESISKNEHEQDFVTKLQQKPISDINEAIGLAEKLLYINELFAKNTDKFMEAVKYINHCSAMEDALFYIENNYKWDFEKEATISFMELVKRKFL